VCLVRSSRVDARERLRACLAGIGVNDSTVDDRVRVIEGDLADPQLGLERHRFNALAGEVDAICHAGADVNWALSYRALRGTNVLGTLDLLRIAAARSLPFHFVSSVSVCCSTSAPDVVDEDYDALVHLRGVHLGYAQTKIVAEALVREAGRRGLPVTVYRPALISGDSATGAFNRDDLLARVVSGCVRMGTIPDLDWLLDCQPVDVISRRIVRLSDRRGVFHLSHAHPRHWREVALWMRMCGYDVQLVPYHAWLRQLERETGAEGDAEHPLRPLRSFFLDRPRDASGVTLAELYEQGRRPAVRTARTDRLLSRQDAPCPALDAALLERYFDAFAASGLVPFFPVPRALDCALALDRDFFSRLLQTDVLSADLVSRSSDHSIVSELTAWRSGRPTGLFRYRLKLRGSDLDCCAMGTNYPIAQQSRSDPRQVVVKIKPSDRETLAVGEALARLCDDRVGEAYARWQTRTGFAQAHVRELAIYQQRDPAFAAHLPLALATDSDERAGTWTLILEHVSNSVLMDAVDRPHAWTADYLDRAIRGLASLQAVWYDREAELKHQPWIGHVASTETVGEMADLWTAIAAHAGPAFSAWADPAIGAIQRRVISGIDRWWPQLETLPRTLIHNDFNPRNICFRPGQLGPTLCVYDWELATIGAPQRDLAELLCFVLAADASDELIDFWIERHRRRLEEATGASIDARTWERGFGAALLELMLNRLPMYALVHRVRRQPFLPRIVRIWRRLYERFPLEATI
jgi:thioester reductase-like protein